MTRNLLVILILSLSQPTIGQIVNSLSADKTGMYFYALDSLTKLIKVEKKIERLILRAASYSTIVNFPDSINGFRIIKESEDQKIKTKHLRQTDVVVRIMGLNIIRDQVTLAMQPLEKREKELRFFSSVVYIFYFQYLPNTQTYTLTKIKR